MTPIEMAAAIGKIQAEIGAINEKLNGLLSIQHNRWKETWAIIASLSGVLLTALIATVSGIWIAVVNPLNGSITELKNSQILLGNDLRASLKEVASNSASRESTALEIAQIRASIARIETQIVTKDEFSSWIGKANRSR